MPIEVDQSNKVERTGKDTFLAFSDGQSFAIVIPAKVKRQALEYLLSQGKTRKIAYLVIFSASLFILLRAYLAQTNPAEERITIDTEYSGQEASIRAMILRYARGEGMAIAAERIVFAQIGKGSKAHDLAWGVQRGKEIPGYRVTLQDLRRLL